MTAEEEMWLRLCLRLHKTPSEAKNQITYVDFLRFWSIIEKEQDESDKRDWYDAQQAYQTWCVSFLVWGKTPPPSVTIEKFLLKFTRGGDGKQKTATDPEVEHESTELARELAIKTDMAMWAAVVGASLPGEEATTPVVTKLPPNMAGMMPQPAPAPATPVPSRVELPNPDVRAVSPANPLPPPGFVPRGKGKRKKG